MWVRLLPMMALAVVTSCARAPVESAAPPYKVAFTGDTDYDASDTPEVDTAFERVLELVKSEAAQMFVIAGDLAYVAEEIDAAAIYFSNVDRVLGESFPVLAADGNHDVWSYYEPILQQRLERMGLSRGLISAADYGLQYGGIHWAVVGERPNAAFVRRQFAKAQDDGWRVCVWHNNMRDMQTGEKPDFMDWPTYRACQDAGAIVATGHEHSYSRTLTLTEMGNRAAGHGATGSPDRMEVAPGRTFVFVSGLGGRGNRRDFDCALHDDDSWWASVYTSNYHLRNGEQVAKSCTEGRDINGPPFVKGYTSGVLFITFNAGGNPRHAEAYFKTIDGEVIDSFTIARP